MQPEKLQMRFPLADLDLDGHLLRITMHPDQPIILESVKEIYHDANNALCEKHVAILLDTRNTFLTHYPEEVLRYVSANENSHKEIAFAILISGLGYRLLAKFYLQMFRPKTPTRIFSSEKEATGWLNETIALWKSRR